jgi:hypothetical protein
MLFEYLTEVLAGVLAAATSVVSSKPAIEIGLRRDCFTLRQGAFASLKLTVIEDVLIVSFKEL